MDKELQDALHRWVVAGETNWLGLGTATEEAIGSDYRRQRISRTNDVVFDNVPSGVTHGQVWDAETGGRMLAYWDIGHTVSAGDTIIIQPDALFSISNN